MLADHPAVLKEPEPSVLADSLGRATINLRVYFWLDGRAHSWLKVRSSLIRLVKRAFQQHGISMPDEAREIIFPRGVPVSILDRRETEPRGAPKKKGITAEAAHEEPDTASTKAEAGLYSEADSIEQQARRVRPLTTRENLLEDTALNPLSAKTPLKRSDK